MEQEILKIENLYFDYSDTSVLRDVNFTLHKGDFLGIIGANGAGKSTLIKIILKILPYNKGKITLFGEDLSKFKENYKIGYVSQKANSFNSDFPATVKEVVMANLYSRRGLFKRYRKEDYEKLSTVLEKVGMSGYENRLIGNLSGGQSQKVFIARALMAQPELIILDEPSVGIDVRSQSELYGLLHRLNKEGLTIIAVEHNLRAAKRNSNFMYHIDNGRGHLCSPAEYVREYVSANTGSESYV